MENNSSKSAIIIVGVGTAFGNELALEFATRGHDIILVGRNVKAMKELSLRLAQHSIVSEILPVNIANPESIKDVFNQILTSGRNIELVIYNAVARRNCSPSVLSATEAIDDFAVSVGGAVECSRIIIPYFRERKGGALIFTGGGVATDPSLNAASLSLSKAALGNYVKNLQEELKQTKTFVGLITITKKIGKDGLPAKVVAKQYYDMFRAKSVREIII